MAKNKESYYDMNWTPPGYKKEEWQRIWRKLWLLSKKDVRNLAKKLGTYFVDKKIQNRMAKKSDFIGIIDDGVSKKELIKELNRLIIKRNKKIK